MTPETEETEAKPKKLKREDPSRRVDVRALRADLGLSINELGYLLRISYRAIYRWEEDSRNISNRTHKDVLLALADVVSKSQSNRDILTDLCEKAVRTDGLRAFVRRLLEVYCMATRQGISDPIAIARESA